jgi:DNA-binding beta-propeller fold protein YncE/cytochrome c553
MTALRLVVGFVLAVAGGAALADAGQLFRQHCAECHGADRFGGVGPALLPSNLERLRKPAAAQVIARGRLATQMPPFGDKLSAEEIKALVSFVYAEPAERPVWGLDQIRASRVQHVDVDTLPAKPAFAADPLNLFVVVEAGDHHVTVLDGDRFAPLARFPSRYALHGGPKFSPDGRYVYFASRDGWITKYDLWNLKTLVEIRAGLNTRNAAVSGDGRYVLVGNYLPHTLVVLDARDLTPVKVIDVEDERGRTSRVSAVYTAAPRNSFVVALKDVPEVWELRYDADAPPVFAGLVHDYRLGEAIGEKGQFTPRRAPLENVLDDFFFDQSYAYVIGASRGAGGQGGHGQVVNLDVRRKITDVPLPGLPHLGSGISWDWNGHRVMATPNLRDGIVSVIDTKTWQILKQIPTNGPGFFMRSHENTPYAWVDAMMSKDRKDTLQIIDKRTLEIVGSVTPEPGKTAAHVEFTRDGRYALVSVWEMDGALVVYDAATFKEVKRLPMKRPVGKYNVYNKITRSEGTSH